MLFITGTVPSVPVSVEARYSEGVLDARLGSVSASSVSSTPVGARSTGGWAPIAECEPDAMSVACTSPEGRSTGSMLEVAGSASTEGRRPTRMLEVTVSSPEDRSTTIVRSTVLSRPSLYEVIWSLVPSGSSVLGSCPEFPSTVAVSSSEDRSTAGSRPSVTVSSHEDRSTAGVLSSDLRLPTTVAVSSSEDRSTAGTRPFVTVSFSEDRSTAGV